MKLQKLTSALITCRCFFFSKYKYYVKTYVLGLSNIKKMLSITYCEIKRTLLILFKAFTLSPFAISSKVNY